MLFRALRMNSVTVSEAVHHMLKTIVNAYVEDAGTNGHGPHTSYSEHQITLDNKYLLFDHYMEEISCYVLNRVH
jgi:hypothetical protein